MRRTGKNCKLFSLTSKAFPLGGPLFYTIFATDIPRLKNVLWFTNDPKLKNQNLLLTAYFIENSKSTHSNASKVPTGGPGPKIIIFKTNRKITSYLGHSGPPVTYMRHTDKNCKVFSLTSKAFLLGVAHYITICYRYTEVEKFSLVHNGKIRF